MSLIEIRCLTSDDAGEWLRLRIEALDQDPEAFSASLEEYRAFSLDDVKKRLWSGADAFVVGAFENGRLIGMAGCYCERGTKSRHKGRIWGVYVASHARGAGIGKKIMRMLLDRASIIGGMDQILLSVTATQTAAIRLYRSLGFEVYGTEPRALRIGDCFFDEHHMLLRLKNSDAR